MKFQMSSRDGVDSGLMLYKKINVSCKHNDNVYISLSALILDNPDGKSSI